MYFIKWIRFTDETVDETGQKNCQTNMYVKNQIVILKNTVSQ